MAQLIEKKYEIEVTRRMMEHTPFITDNGNYILDCALNREIDPYQVHEFLIHLVGVLETGYFFRYSRRSDCGNGTRRETH